jgi:C_GCAxxG_C_C family probable redox protein
MDKRVEKALLNHDKGYNCAQAVACAYSDLVDVDEKVLFRMTEGFGAGMGNFQNTCGAVAGAIVLAGLKNSGGNLEGPKTKGSTYQISRRILKEFEQKNGSAVCKDLKGLETKKILRTCSGCINDAVEIIGQILEEKE